jgi:MraZ protein
MASPVLGRHDKQLDKLGRFVLPDPVRKAFGEGEPLVLSPWLDGCLALFSLEGFNELTKQVTGNRARRFEKTHRMLLRYVGSYATKVTYDKQGRLTFPEKLRELANIRTDISIVGCFDMAEIWSTSLLDVRMKEMKGEDWNLAFESALCATGGAEASPEGGLRLSPDDIPGGADAAGTDG